MAKTDYSFIIDKVQEELQAYRNQGYDKPTLRSMFYRLASKSIIPNTKAGYRSLLHYCTKARWKGDLAMNCFADESRTLIQDYNDQFFTPEQLIEGHFDKIKNMSEEYVYIVPRWYKQPHYVEVWIEKKAMINNFVPILRDRDVTIVPTSGFDSTPQLYASFNRMINQYHEADKDVHILYYGDSDPSGEGMDEDLNNRLQKLTHILGCIKIDFQRIAVTEDQIDQYNLPTAIDAKTREKLERDPRAANFLDKYGELRQVELDALPAIVPDQFRQLILESVDKFFDERSHQEMLAEIEEKYSHNEIEKIVKDKYLAQAKRYSDIDEK